MIYVPVKATPMSNSILFLSHGSKNLIDYSENKRVRSVGQPTNVFVADQKTPVD